MTPPEFQRIEAVFDAVADAPVDERAALLDRLCAGDAALRAEVESLLAASPGAKAQIRGAIGGAEAGVPDTWSAPSSAPSDLRTRLPGEGAGRFRIERLVGTGGMGAVYRALDTLSGEAVALKVLLDRGAEAERFAREAEVLAGLRHPAIVRYAAHGTTDSGEPYLAMEWLEGEDLAARLRRGPLGVDETVALVTRVAEALAAVHAADLVHRDLKPSNLFLVAGDPARVKLLDFGVARLASSARMTKTGALIGTPAYMAPEQARGERRVDARADVFALGCVLYECLLGRPAFAGEHFMAILAKILFVEVPRPSEADPAVPEALDALCARMLAKLPEDRPRDMAEVVAALAAVPRGAPAAARSRANAPPSLTGNERRVLSVVLMAGSGEDPSGSGDAAASFSSLRRQAEARGGHIERLADGSTMVTLVGSGVATDRAARAARCALDLRAEGGGRPIVLTTLRAQVKGTLPDGEVIDRAARMLAELARVPRGDAAAVIAVDDVTAGLLDDRFEVEATDTGHVLLGERALGIGARRLLGRPTVYVGRDVELGTLTASFAACVEESAARAVLVTAPAGMGKTRLARELVLRVQQRDEPVSVWVGRGDPLRAGAAFGLLGPVVAGVCGLRDGEPLEARRAKILVRARAAFAEADARRVAEFLGEIVGAPFPDEESVALRAARQEAEIMAWQTRSAFVDFLGAACDATPVLLLLEDLHWSDQPTVRFVDEALRRLNDKPWMVIALARPELHDRFPRLWAERGVQEIRLHALSPKAGARLVRQVLGAALDAAAVERIVAQADGNAFYLEELIRAAADPRPGDATLPETVLAMVQSRIEALDGEARRVLRAASVFGEVFWREGVEALLGGADALDGAPALDDTLARLARREWVDPRPEARIQGQRELCFRHALVREAAYGMLTEDDRALGHRLAGAWLEQVGEASAAVIAQHYERGGQPAHAARCYERAAAQALAANDIGAVLAWTGRGLGLEAAGAVRGELAVLRAGGLYWRGDLAEAERWTREALAALPQGSPPWYAAVGEAAEVARRRGEDAFLAELAAGILAAWSTDEATGPMVAATARLTFNLLLAGLYPQAEALCARIEAAAPRFDGDPAVMARVFEAFTMRARLSGSVARSFALGQEAMRCYERAGHLVQACRARTGIGYIECRLGSYAAAEALLRPAIADAERMGLANLLIAARQNLGLALVGLGALDEARAVTEQAIAASVAHGDPRMEGGSRVYIALILTRLGELEAAEAEARRAKALLAVAKPKRVHAQGALAEVLLARGRAAEALAEAGEGMALLASLGRVDEGEALLRLVHAEALAATGDEAGARAAIAEARDRLRVEADGIDDPARHRTFLEAVPENARTLALAREWVGA
jgi:ATP/maltotriose-dependent transcriptional regulator MalT